MNRIPITTETQYLASLARLEEFFDADSGTPEGDEAALLTAMIKKYEQEKYPIGPPIPIEAIRFRMEQQRVT